MKFQSIQDALGFCWHKHLVETGRRMSVELVLDEHNLFGLRKIDIDQIAHTVSPVSFGASFCNFDVAPVLKWGKEHEQVRHAFTPIFMIILFQLSWDHRQSLTSLTHQLF